MTTPSVRMLTVFLFAAAALNLANYIFCLLYYPTPQQIRSKIQRQYRRQFRHIPTKAVQWDNAKLECTVILNDLNNTAEERSSETVTPATSFYYDLRNDKSDDKLCPEIPPDLGPVSADDSINNLDAFDDMYTDVLPGGVYKPSTCKPRHKVAVIVPFRGKKNQLGTFLYFLHSILMKQQLDYQIFVVEQGNASEPFNRGKLLNAGFTEVYRRGDLGSRFQCLILHESNILPLDSRNLYRCSWYPRQLAVIVEKSDKTSYEVNFGGAVALSLGQYLTVNGFSNHYWSNNADYDDMYERLVAKYSIERNAPDIGRYFTLKNTEPPVVNESKTAHTSFPVNLIDGLTSLSYSVNDYDLRRFYTYINISFDMNEPSSHCDSWLWNKLIGNFSRTTTKIKTLVLTNKKH